ncbi:hypothetical protein H312_02848 [Anncaliia algerae PRA339]|uniref:Uncharacterized protein n=1 Tax=Anncaliia algerae PRA339 TaxID=1288291 RepID=A0A059EXV8_9MICR|nr:hypothetical protein H312_02848 [Anncaliia algerae PRA339]
MRLASYKNTFHRKCKWCLFAISLFVEMIFFYTKLSIPQLLELVCFWSNDQRQTNVKS